MNTNDEISSDLNNIKCYRHFFLRDELMILQLMIYDLAYDTNTYVKNIQNDINVTHDLKHILK